MNMLCIFFVVRKWRMFECVTEALVSLLTEGAYEVLAFCFPVDYTKLTLFYLTFSSYKQNVCPIPLFPLSLSFYLCLHPKPKPTPTPAKLVVRSKRVVIFHAAQVLVSSFCNISPLLSLFDPFFGRPLFFNMLCC